MLVEVVLSRPDAVACVAGCVEQIYLNELAALSAIVCVRFGIHAYGPSRDV